MHIEWSIFALDDREAIFDYIEQDSPRAAVAVDNRIEQQVEALEHFPEMGRAGRLEPTRELVIQRTPYIAVYRVHGAQQWPEETTEMQT
jgi:toxin ParE1/3/4